MKNTAIHFFENQVKVSPNKIALTYNNNGISYFNLHTNANKIASLLVENDVKKGDLISIFMERSIIMAETILAIWKVGAAYVLIDPTYSDQRITEILEIVKPKASITTDKKSESRINKFDPLSIERYSAEIEEYNGDNIFCDTDERDVAYVFFTSGSTGKPKGAQIEHLGAFNHMCAKIKDCQMSEASIMAQTATMNFNIFNWQMFGPLTIGATTVIYSNKMVMEPQKLLQWLRNDKVTHLQTTPSYLNLLLEFIEKDESSLSQLKMLLQTGEPLNAIIVNKWLSIYPKIPILNSYGCTEVSDDSVHKLLDRTVTIGHPVPIGRPIPYTKVYIVKLDEENGQVLLKGGKPKLCDAGETGQIWLAGDIVVGRGYLEDGPKKGDSFGIDPFTGERLFKIGDLGYLMENGDIVCLGRRDSQVKINGQRVDISEIESQILASESDISNVVVVPWKLKNGKQFLTAYFKSQRKFKILELRGFKGILNHLPIQMVPSFWVQLEKIPTLPSSNKVDRKRLRMVNGDKNVQHKNQIMVRAETKLPIHEEEKLIASIWSKVLNLKEIGIHENNINVNECFFNLGGDSLSAAKLAKELEKYGYELNLAEFGQASAIQERHRYLRKIECPLKDNQSLKLFPHGWKDTRVGIRFKELGFHMFTIDQLLHKYEGKGDQVIRMTLGKSDRKLKKEVVNAMKEALDDGLRILKVDSEGNEEFRKTITDYYFKRFNVSINVENILVGSQGTSSVYRDLFHLLLQDGGEVLLPKPGYILYEAAARIVETVAKKKVTVKYYSIDLDTNLIDIDSFKDNFCEHNTRVIVFNSPGNPSGNIIKKDEWCELIDVINSGKNSIVFCDQVYSNIVFSNEKYPSLLEDDLMSRLKRPCVITDSMSKGFEMYTFRVGFAILPDDLIQPMITLQRNFSLTPNVISQIGAQEALRTSESTKTLTALFAKRNLYAQEKLLTTKTVKMVPTHGGFYFLLDCRELIKKIEIANDYELAYEIAENTNPHVGTAPGSDFGAPGYLRISLSPDLFEKGIDVLVKYIKEREGQKKKSVVNAYIGIKEEKTPA